MKINEKHSRKTPGWRRQAISLLTICAALVGISQQVHAEPVRKPKIINGEDAPEGAWPWMAALLYNGVNNASRAQFCGGALISDRHILTAAHCVSLFKQNEIQVLLGETKLPFGKGNRLEISGFVIHPRFEGNTLEHDLAIIKLRKPVDIPPVKLALPSDAALYQPGTNAFTMGWGFKDANMPILPANLQQAEIPLVSDEVCVDELGRLFIPDSMMCAGKKATSSTSGDGVDSCIGDSGGPMVVSDGAGGWKLVGVVSWGLGSCANEKTRGVYAEVPVHEDFVTSFPDIAPYFTSTPFVSGDGTVGSAMVCNLGEMGGDPATSISYSWYRDGSIITDATSETYTVEVEDQGGYIGCSVSASNSAGSSNTEYSATTLVPAAQIQEVTQTATPTPSPGDTTPPQAAVTSFVCKSHKCFVTIAATDSESGVQDVSATVRFSYSATCAKKRGCTKTKAKQLKLRRGQLGSWAGNFRYAKRKAQKASIEIVARDAAGNATPVMAVASKSL